MSMYNLQASEYGNLEWKAYYLREEDDKTGLIESINNKNEYISSLVIKMLYVNIYKEIEKSSEELFLSDMVYWGDNITYKAYTPYGQGCMIVSKKLKKVFEDFALPPHSFYNVELFNELNRSKSNDYELLHIHGNSWEENLIIEECVFELRDDFTDEVLEVQKGGFKSYEEMLKISSKMSREEDKAYHMTEGVFNIDYDVMWGVTNILYVNDKVKEAIEKESLNGVECFPFKKSMIQYVAYQEFLNRNN